LYVCPTPIGNLEDITLRALRVLNEVDIIAAEDTRVTRKLLTHYNIQTPLISYHKHTEREKSKVIINELLAGKSIALVTDSGTPLISDPGNELITAAIHNQIKVTPLPGASALTCALSASGLSENGFIFYGFLPRGEQKK
jgi:16S rRNA (cytidine1402-2'-O)-methyltransferase